MHRVAETLSNLFAYVFPDTDDVAGRSHLDNLTVVRQPVEGGMHQQPSFAEERLDVEWHLHVGGIHVLVLQDHRIEFQYASFFWVHISVSCSRYSSGAPQIRHSSFFMTVVSF